MQIIDFNHVHFHILSFHLPVSVGPVLSPNNLSLVSYLFNVCVHVDLCSGCVQIYLLMCAGALGGQRLVKTLELFFRCCLHHVFWDGVCHWLRVYQVGKAGWTASPRDPPICAFLGQEDKCMPAQIWLCVCVFWRLNSGPHACTAGASLTAPSQLPSSLSFKCKFCIS